FNDGFVAYLSAKGFNKGQPENMSLDKNNNPVSVNNNFFDRCTPGVTTQCAGGGGLFAPKSVCAGGPGELAGTGFGITGSWPDPTPSDTSADCGKGEQSTSGGSTGWLTSQAPVQSGEQFTLELMVFDSGDGILDSSVLLDNFRWLAGKADPGTDRPVK